MVRISTGQPAAFGAFDQILGKAAVLFEVELEPEGPVDRARDILDRQQGVGGERERDAEIVRRPARQDLAVRPDCAAHAGRPSASGIATFPPSIVVSSSRLETSNMTRSRKRMESRSRRFSRSVISEKEPAFDIVHERLGHAACALGAGLRCWRCSTGLSSQLAPPRHGLRLRSPMRQASA